MAGGGGSGPFVGRSPEQLAQKVRQTENATAIRAFDTQLSSLLADLLSEANSRDSELVQARLDDIKAKLSDVLEKSIDSRFGGSVAKHTYVDGLSDIDSLLILNDSTLQGEKPSVALHAVAKTIKSLLGDKADVSIGKLAVTVKYSDGMTIQLLPAFKTESGLRVPSSRHDGWSGISPDKFQAALTTRNEECAGKLVPTIKLAKAIMGTLPEEQRLSGYHVESLAIQAFRGYAGTKTVSAMLPTFFEAAKELVKAPIRDSTGQSIHVDDYLGNEGGAARMMASHILGRLAKRMRNASAHASTAQWHALFRSNDD